MPLYMDSAYRDAKEKIFEENRESVKKQVLEAFGEAKGRAIFDGLFSRNDDKDTVASPHRRKRAG